MEEKFRGKGIYLLIAASFFLSLMGAGVKYVSVRIPIFEIVFFRAITGTIIVLLLAALRKRNVWGKEKTILWMRGIFGFCAISCFFFAISRIPLADAVLISYTSPIFVAILSIFFLHERISTDLFIFIAVALASIYFILKPDLQTLNSGALSAIGAGFFAALAFVWIKKLKRESPLSIIFYFSFVTTCISCILMLPSFVKPTHTELFVLIINGILATIAQIFFTIAILVEKVSAASALTCLSVIFSYFIGLIFWDELLEPSSLIAGLVLIVSSIIFSRKNLTKKKAVISYKL